MAEYSTFLDFMVFGNSGMAYATALLIIIAGIVLLKLFKTLVVHRLKAIAQRTAVDFDDFVISIIDEIHWPFYVLVSLYVAFQTLVLPEIVVKIMQALLMLGITYYIIRSLSNLLDYGTKKVIANRQKHEKAGDVSVIMTLSKMLKGILWGVAIVMALSNLGYNVSAIVAGLGIGGLAVAFAFQKILEDVFSSISIYFDKPFEIGDFIIVGENMGTVKRIGIKSTRLQALQGEEIVISNRELTSVRIQNYKKMKKRRIAFAFGVVYQTDTAKLNKAAEIVRAVVKKAEHAELDRVHFKSFGSSSLDFEVVYFTNTGDYNVYMDTQQEINLGIKEAFEKEGIEFAYPTQTIYMAK
jgi:small-conductance mechanosensitive channel